MLVAIYSLASALGAFLIFLVQPMIAKAALPTLGGAPYVWNGCMVFFQAALLLGYLYAHLGARWLTPKKQALLHFLLLLSALSCFPLDFSGPSAIDPVQSPLTWLLTLLAVSVGLPFLVISATAPLLQRWFAATGHARAGNPYFLYAASNAGSFAALLGYPLLVEPGFTLAAQAEWMRWGTVALVALFALCAWHLRRPAAVSLPGSSDPAPAPALQTRLRWIALAFVPASLLYGVTTYLTTDIASVPLLWVLPLALYLLTFIFAFAEKPAGVAFARRWHLFGVTLLALFMVLPTPPMTGVLLLHLAIFFILCLACHGRLSALRPGSRHLTEFYLWLSFGGVLGGLFNTLAAPLLFTQVIEYKLALLAAVVLLGTPLSAHRERAKIAEALLGTLSALGIFLLLFAMPEKILPMVDASQAPAAATRIALLLCVGLVVWIYARFHRYRLAFAASLALALLAIPPLAEHAKGERLLFSARNFFGVNRVAFSPQREAHQFWHGTTNHGVQSLRPEDRLHPVAYYTPLKQVFASLSAPAARAPIAVMGLGVGTVACYGRKGQVVDFYEIDPLVERIARDASFFTYLSDCPPTSHVILGDARLKMQSAGNAHYGIMVMDAFSSDAIPVHLLTREALGIYLAKLAPHGVIAYNISNRHLELKPVLAAQAEALGLSALTRFDDPAQASVSTPARTSLPASTSTSARTSLPVSPSASPSASAQHAKPNRLSFASEWVVLARDAKDIAPLLKEGWRPLPPASPRDLWTDHYSNLVGSLKLLR